MTLYKLQSPYTVNVRDKIFELENEVLEIKTNTTHSEQNIQTQVEKENIKFT